jgi:hypothetical protein
MSIALYACGQETGSSRPGDSVQDQIHCIRMWIGDDARSVTEFTDLDPSMEPLLRPGIQCLLQWLHSPAGEGAIVTVAHARFLFAKSSECCGQLTQQLLHNEIHFVKENLHAGTTANRGRILSHRIRSSLATHAHGRERQRKRRQHAMTVFGHGSTQAWYGYRKTQGKENLWIPHDSELRVVHLIHDLRWVVGFTPLRIMAELSEHHDVSMSRSLVGKILQRPRPKDRSEWAFLSPIFLEWVTKRQDANEEKT